MTHITIMNIIIEKIEAVLRKIGNGLRKFFSFFVKSIDEDRSECPWWAEIGTENAIIVPKGKEWQEGDSIGVYAFYDKEVTWPNVKYTYKDGKWEYRSKRHHAGQGDRYLAYYPYKMNAKGLPLKGTIVESAAPDKFFACLGEECQLKGKAQTALDHDGHNIIITFDLK